MLLKLFINGVSYIVRLRNNDTYTSNFVVAHQSNVISGDHSCTLWAGKPWHGYPCSGTLCLIVLWVISLLSMNNVMFMNIILHCLMCYYIVTHKLDPYKKSHGHLIMNMFVRTKKETEFCK
jgi:hypothetical protein